MPSWLIHLELVIIFIAAFTIGTFIWDLDHLKCDPKILSKALTKDGYNELNNLDRIECRGIFHDYRFAFGFFIFSLAYFIHLFMDNIPGLNP